MSTWVSAAPVIGTGSLDGFAFGALMTGACALAITGPRRARRSSAARDDAARAAERSGWLCEHVMRAEAAGSGLRAEAAGSGLRAEAAGSGLRAEAAGSGLRAEAAESGLAAEISGAALERRARREDVGAHGKGRSAPGREGRAAGGYQSRHRRGDPIPGSRREAHPHVVLADAESPERTFVSPTPPEVRRLPRHAAPSVSFGSRITGLGSRMTGLFAARALASGARG
jgi:hypothetical protein